MNRQTTSHLKHQPAATVLQHLNLQGSSSAKFWHKNVEFLFSTEEELPYFQGNGSKTLLHYKMFNGVQVRKVNTLDFIQKTNVSSFVYKGIVNKIYKRSDSKLLSLFKVTGFISNVNIIGTPMQMNNFLDVKISLFMC